MMRPLLCVGLILLAGCTVNRDAGNPTTGQAARDAALQPLSDVNVVRPGISPTLVRAVQAPYAPPRGASCAALSAEVRELNQALGPDFDVDMLEGDGRERRDRALGLAGRFGAGMLIPFRGVVRELSGSAKNEREYRSAIVAGVARRAFLRGKATEQGCPPPAGLQSE